MKRPIKPYTVSISICLLFASLILSYCGNETKTGTNAIAGNDSLGTVYGPYKLIKLPVTKGVKILNPIQLAKGPGGKLFAANQNGEVYTLNDSDADEIEDEALLYCNVSDFKLRTPSGFAYKGDTVYIGTAQEIRAFVDLNKDGKADSSWTFFNDIPYSEHPYEWTSAMNFSKDGWLYFVLSTDSWNAGASPDPKKYRGAILRISPDGKKVERIATGLRSVYGAAFNESGDLFFVDNEGMGNPKEELNILTPNAFYGHNPAKYVGHDSTTGPVHALETEVAPSGAVFNSTSNNFGETAGELFVSFYGPGERWKRGGVGRIKITKDANGSYRFEENPVADVPKLSALVFNDKGDLYLAYHGKSDYWYNSIENESGGFFKLVYDESLKDKYVKTRIKKVKDFSPISVEAGKQIFGERACAACHSVDGSTELLGPNLRDVGKRLSREEILEEIETPSKIIKPSMGAIRITKKDGQVLLGRAVNADEQKISLMLVGNKVVDIPRTEIAKTENEKQSLMFEKLTSTLSREQLNNLLDYLTSLR